MVSYPRVLLQIIDDHGSIGSPMVTTGDPPAMRRNSSHDGDFSKENCDFTNTYGDLAYYHA